MSQTINKIYLHWTGINYNWCVPSYYHTIILGNGKARRLTGYDQTLNQEGWQIVGIGGK